MTIQMTPSHYRVIVKLSLYARKEKINYEREVIVFVLFFCFLFTFFVSWRYICKNKYTGIKGHFFYLILSYTYTFSSSTFRLSIITYLLDLYLRSSKRFFMYIYTSLHINLYIFHIYRMFSIRIQSYLIEFVLVLIDKTSYSHRY